MSYKVRKHVIRYLLPVWSLGRVTKDPTQVIEEGTEVCPHGRDLRCAWLDRSSCFLSFVRLGLLRRMRGKRCFPFTSDSRGLLLSYELPAPCLSYDHLVLRRGGGLGVRDLLWQCYDSCCSVRTRQSDEAATFSNHLEARFRPLHNGRRRG